MTGTHGKPLICVLALAGLLAGCSPHAITENPAPRVAGPAQYSAAPAEPGMAAGPWYEGFGDQKLNTLIAQSFEGSLDVVQAVARYKQSAALARQSGALRLPSLDAQAQSRKERTGGTDEEGFTALGATLSWEADLFNRLGAGATADARRSAAAAADIDAVRLFLSADLAEAYYGAVAQHQQIALLQQQAETDTKLLDLNELRFREGVVAKVDVLQQQSQLSETQSLIPVAEAALRVFENQLDILSGAAPDGMDRTDDEDRLPELPALPATGVPSDLLLNRPDLRALRLELEAADADIAAAIADRLPRLTLTGSAQYADGPSLSGPAYALLGSLIQPLLDWGRRRAEVERNKALYEEQLAAFTQAYIEAIGDVENALYQEKQQHEFIRQLRARRDLLQETVEQTQAQYTQGLTDYLPVLSALKDLRTVERTLIREQQTLINYRIQLHRALGSGLQATEKETP